MRRLILAAVALLLGACATQLAQTPPAGMANEVAAPQWAVGSVWRYSVSDGFTRLDRGTVEYRVRAVEADAVTVDVLAGAQETTEVYARDGNWLRRPATNMQPFSYRPAYRAFDFPLAPGKTWDARSTATDLADGRSFALTVKGAVLGWERIKVPAGEFDTLKIRRVTHLDYFRLGERGPSIIQETDWYAPALNQVVRREAVSQYMQLAQAPRPSGFIRVESDISDGSAVPRWEQDDWLVYQLVEQGGR